MDHIILEKNNGEGIVFDVGQLMTQFEQLTDKRRARGKRYSLPFLLILILLAKLAGENTPKGIAEWLQLRRQQIVKTFRPERETVPAYNTIRRTLAYTMVESELQSVLRQFLHQTYGGQQSVQVTLDGKTMRGTIPKGETGGVHLLAAYLPEERVVLMQVAVDAKENEITAAPRVLAALDLKERIVSGDAMFTQRALSVQVVAQGGHYIWFVKDNQKQLREDVAQFFVPPRKEPGWHIPQLPQQVAISQEKSNGRLEKRTLTLMADDTDFIDWPALQQVFKLDRRVICSQTGLISEETVYGVTSLSSARASAQDLLQWTRSHWGIENGLHFRRDTTLQEDAIQMRDPHQAQVTAVLNNFLVALTSKMGISNLASARRRFDAAITVALASSG